MDETSDGLKLQTNVISCTYGVQCQDGQAAAVLGSVSLAAADNAADNAAAVWYE